jgi:hypothetical protein
MSETGKIAVIETVMIRKSGTNFLGFVKRPHNKKRIPAVSKNLG